MAMRDEADICHRQRPEEVKPALEEELAGF
jgi:hypothetical protein